MWIFVSRVLESKYEVCFKSSRTSVITLKKIEIIEKWNYVIKVDLYYYSHMKFQRKTLQNKQDMAKV